jgi:hypothetical protein
MPNSDGIGSLAYNPTISGMVVCRSIDRGDLIAETSFGEAILASAI